MTLSNLECHLKTQISQRLKLFSGKATEPSNEVRPRSRSWDATPLLPFPSTEPSVCPPPDATKVEPRCYLLLIHPLRTRLGHLCRTILGVEGNRERCRFSDVMDTRRFHWDFRSSFVAAILPIDPSGTTKWPTGRGQASGSSKRRRKEHRECFTPSC